MQSLRNKVNHTALLIRALQGRGDIYHLLGNYRKAIEDYRTIQRYDENQIIAYIGISEVLEKMGKYQLALEYVNRAFKKCFDDIKKIELLNQKAFLLMRLGNLSRLRNIDQSIQNLIRHNKQKLERIRIALAYNFYNRSIFYLQTGRFNLALKFARMSARIALHLKDKRRLGLVYNLLGIINRKFGKFDLSLRYYQKSLTYFTKIGDIGQIAGVYTNIGNIQSDYQNALLYHKKAFSIFSKIGYNMGIAEAAHNIGNANLALGLCRKAIGEYVKAYKLSRKMSYKFGTALNLAGIGKAYKLLGNYKSAYKCFLKSLSLSTEIKDREGILENIYMIALLKNDKADKNTWCWFNKAQHLAEELLEYNLLTEIIYEELRYLIFQNNTKKAFRLAEKIKGLDKVGLSMRARSFLLLAKMQLQNCRTDMCSNEQKETILKELERIFSQTSDREMVFYIGRALIDFSLMENIEKGARVFATMKRLLDKTEMKVYYPEIFFLKARLNYYQNKKWHNDIKRALSLAKEIGSLRVIKEIDQWLKLRSKKFVLDSHTC